MAKKLLMSDLRVILALTAVSTFFACSEPTVDHDELVERDGVFYQKFSTEPFNGEVVGSTQGRVVNGRWNGSVLQFTPNGNLSLEENYVDGIPSGEQLFYDDNSLRLREIFIDGEKVKTTRFREGIITSVSNYLDGVEHGAYEVFYPNGNTMYRIHYDNGNRIEDVIDVFASDGKTQIKVPVSQGKDVHWLYADGAVEIVGNDDCAVIYEKGREPLLMVDIEFDNDDPLAIERNKQRSECTEVIKKIIDDASLTNYVVENLFPSED
ncbi:hypothetical protein N9393_01320 [Luminiphilus sp.]|nr:hypothetical protein [Luminiphilus sp.]